MQREALEKAVHVYHTPLYLFDLDALSGRMEQIRGILGSAGIKVCYAMKANPFLTKEMAGLADCLEVCSPGELRICEREQIPMEQLVISGVNKEPGDILGMLRTHGTAKRYTIESRQQMELLASCASETHTKLSVLVRLTSGNQFGVDWEEAKEMFASQERYPQLIFTGIQYYSGTQKQKPEQWKKELEQLLKFCREVTEESEAVLKEIEYGPGFPVSYFRKEEEREDAEFLGKFVKLVQSLPLKEQLTLELGRFLTASCGCYATTIVDRKENNGQLYGIVDGGIHQLNYYGQMMAMKLPYVEHIPKEAEGMQEAGKKEKWNICGSLCTIADVIVKQLPLAGAKVGDTLVFTRTGAYSMTEGISLFLSRDLPKVCSYSQSRGLELLRDTCRTDAFNSRDRNGKETNAS